MTEQTTKKSLFNHKMTRQEFLKYGGVALLSLFGIKNFISLLNHPELMKNQASSVDQNTSKVFGTRKFGA